MNFTQSTIELGAQEAWPINVLLRWLKVTRYVQHKINCSNIIYIAILVLLTCCK